MNCVYFDEGSLDKNTIFSKDQNGREISIYSLTECLLQGDSLFYPNTKIYSFNTDKAFNPIREKTMSLGSEECRADEIILNKQFNNTEECPVFFFIYNTDNYFHFVYDTLPYLISYLHLRKIIPNLKLLMNYPNSQKREFYKFVIEFLNILNIHTDQIILGDSQTLYKKLYISNSYTHDIDSNLPPRKEIYNLYNKIIESVKSTNVSSDLPEKIYISRRTWIHNDFSNIGTNYTMRRKLINENELVDFLNSKGYKEIFAENLSTPEKILLFNNAKKIIGAIGGGMCNALFSQNDINLYVLVSPTFLDNHQRFKYSFTNKNTTYFDKTYHKDSSYWKKYMRVKIKDKNIIGEIDKVFDTTLLISYADHNVAGWNSELELTQGLFNQDDCKKLDDGLNCEWGLDIEELKKLPL